MGDDNDTSTEFEQTRPWHNMHGLYAVRLAFGRRLAACLCMYNVRCGWQVRTRDPKRYYIHIHYFLLIKQSIIMYTVRTVVCTYFINTYHHKCPLAGKRPAAGESPAGFPALWWCAGYVTILNILVCAERERAFDLHFVFDMHNDRSWGEEAVILSQLRGPAWVPNYVGTFVVVTHQAYEDDNVRYLPTWSITLLECRWCLCFDQVRSH